uniref:AlNc14C7G995 protein n=1 Tax=Albugo laibachii Nc14 TaxID=890382 RepID=F0W1R5_9STRA|nr:AlNc14C7G995 [Albugo laibachii Nc14]|eukprot:CCA14994.1 AlNc14C7G995 [Albugo laibachii Nc14]
MDASNQTLSSEDSDVQSDEDSDYYPSENESVNSETFEIEDESTFEFKVYPDTRKLTPISENTISSNSKVKVSNGKSSKVSFEMEDTRFWLSLPDKQQWIARYHAANQAWIKTYGCCIDSLAHPQITRKLQKERSVQFYYRLILLVIICCHTLQINKRYHWISSTSPVESIHTPNYGESNNIVPPSIDELAHRMAIICRESTLQLAKAENEASSRQKAIRLCNEAVEYQLRYGSRMLQSETLVLRGDLWSVLAEFDSSERDYREAIMVAKESIQWSVPHVLDLKIFANQILQLMLRKEYALLQDKCDYVLESSNVQEMREMARVWIQALRKKAPLKTALKKCRVWTLFHAKIKGHELT